MKLSICMPTYNRAGHLQNLLGVIFSQLEKYALLDVVEVLVSDNDSPDNTSEIVQKYLPLGLRYSKNPTNIGPDANFLKLFEMATGDYIWLPGDDDSINADTLAYIIKLIDTEQFDYLYLRSTGAQPTPQRGAVVVTARQLLMSTSIYTTFMTSQVIRASLIKAEISEARKFLGGFMAYYSIFLKTLYRSSKCLISDCQEVYAGSAANTGGYRFYKVWSVSVTEVLLESPFGADQALVSRFKTDMLLYLLLPITFQVRTSSDGFRFDSEDPSSALATYYNDPISKALWSFYLKGNLLLLKLVNIGLRTTIKARRLFNRQVI